MPVSSASASISRLGWRLTAGTLLIYLSTAGGSLATKDAVVMFEQTRHMIDDRTFALPVQFLGDRSQIGVDGRSYSPFGIGQSIYNVPFFLAGRAVKAAGFARAIPDDALTKAVVALGGTVASAAVVGLSFLLAWRLTGDPGASATAAILVAFGTLLWPYSKFGFNAPLAALGVTSTVYLVLVAASSGRTRAAILAGVSLASALLTRHELMLMLIPIAGWWWLETNARRATWKTFVPFGFCVAAGLACWATYNYVRFGSPLRAGYRPAFGVGGVIGFLLSPEGSVLLYMPVVVAGIWGLSVLVARRVPAATLLALVSTTLFAFYASLADWLGTRSYGPRYLVAITPLLVAPAAALLAAHAGSTARALTLACGLTSAIIQIPAVLVDFTKVRIDTLAGEGHVPYRASERPLAASSIVRTVRRAGELVPANAEYLSGRRQPPAGRPDASLGDRFAFSLDLWWMYLIYMRVLRAAAAFAAGLIPLAAGVWLVGSAAARAPRLVVTASADA